MTLVKRARPTMLVLIGLLISLVLWPDRSAAQVDFKNSGLPQLPRSGIGQAASNGPKVDFSASYQLEKGTRDGRLTIAAQIAPNHHIYSTTQPKGGPLPTKIQIPSEWVEVTGPFVPNHAPQVSKVDVFPVAVEEFHENVQWTAPIRVKTEAPEPTSESASAPIAVKITGQVCLTDGNCQPLKNELEAAFAGFYGGSSATYELRPGHTHGVWSASIQPSNVRPGETATVSLSVATDPGYHVYTFSPTDPSPNNRTLIVASQKAGLKFGTPKTDARVVTQKIGADTTFEFLDGPVTWIIPIEVPKDAELGQRPIEMLVGFNTCNDRSCDPPEGIKITGSLIIANQRVDSSAQLQLEPMKWNEVAGYPSRVGWIDPIARTQSIWERSDGARLEWWMVGAALLGGFLLNFMPCVLPVIGLKLMGFVNQAGSSHRRVIALNLSFAAGILAVMLGLAAANIAFKLAGQAFGWGEQFNRLDFQVALVILLFAMSLSFLGVWEIPIPGFASGTKSNELLKKEGLSGAFYKGVLTTLLATPCSGPFLGSLFGLTLTLSVWSIVGLFLLVGIGLALPYLALCLWPGFVKVLPKPGAWMETLKEFLAFPLLLTVVYFIWVIHPDYRIATLTLLIAVWFGCWLIGRVPAYAERPARIKSWIAAVTVGLLAGIASFTYLGPPTHHLPWQDYSESALAEHRAEGKTVMIEFTARWCATCQYNMAFAIDLPQVAAVMEKNNIAPLLADWTDHGEPIRKKLNELGSNSIPLVAIYPADPEAPPILLRDVITQSQLIEALEQASLSKPTAARLTSIND